MKSYIAYGLSIVNGAALCGVSASLISATDWDILMKALAFIPSMIGSAGAGWMFGALFSGRN